MEDKITVLLERICKMSRYITVKEMAKDYGCNENYIYDLLAVGYIRNSKVGRNYRVLRKDYEEFLEKCLDLPPYEELRKRAVAARKERRAA